MALMSIVSLKTIKLNLWTFTVWYWPVIGHFNLITPYPFCLGVLFHNMHWWLGCRIAFLNKYMISYFSIETLHFDLFYFKTNFKVRLIQDVVIFLNKKKGLWHNHRAIWVKSYNNVWKKRMFNGVFFRCFFLFDHYWGL